MMRLTRVDLPTLGRPTTATTGTGPAAAGSSEVDGSRDHRPRSPRRRWAVGHGLTLLFSSRSRRATTSSMPSPVVSSSTASAACAAGRRRGWSRAGRGGPGRPRWRRRRRRPRRCAAGRGPPADAVRYTLRSASGATTDADVAALDHDARPAPAMISRCRATSVPAHGGHGGDRGHRARSPRGRGSAASTCVAVGADVRRDRVGADRQLGLQRRSWPPRRRRRGRRRPAARPRSPPGTSRRCPGRRRPARWRAAGKRWTCPTPTDRPRPPHTAPAALPQPPHLPTSPTNPPIVPAATGSLQKRYLDQRSAVDTKEPTRSFDGTPSRPRRSPPGMRRPVLPESPPSRAKRRKTNVPAGAERRTVHRRLRRAARMPAAQQPAIARAPPGAAATRRADLRHRRARPRATADPSPNGLEVSRRPP